MSEIVLWIKDLWAGIQKGWAWFSAKIDAIEARFKVLWAKVSGCLMIPVRIITWPFRTLVKVWKKGCLGKIFAVVLLVVYWQVCSNATSLTLSLGILNGPLAAITGFQPRVQDIQNVVSTLQNSIPTEIFIPPTPRPVVEEFCEPIKVTVDEVLESGVANIRNGPSTIGTEVVNEVELGEEFIVIGKFPGTDGAMWAKLLLPGTETGIGWIAAVAVTDFDCVPVS